MRSEDMLTVGGFVTMGLGMVWAAMRLATWWPGLDVVYRVTWVGW